MRAFLEVERSNAKACAIVGSCPRTAFLTVRGACSVTAASSFGVAKLHFKTCSLGGPTINEAIVGTCCCVVAAWAEHTATSADRQPEVGMSAQAIERIEWLNLHSVHGDLLHNQRTSRKTTVQSSCSFSGFHFVQYATHTH
jgi:hypothetical protein